MAEHDLTVKAWRRYGKDRLYVSDARGRTLGYLDRLTDQVHVDHDDHRVAVTRALRTASGSVVPEHGSARTEQPAAAPIPVPAVDRLQPYAVTINNLAVDLAGNAAGGGAQAKADELRRQAPVRTLVARVLGVHTDERAWRVGARGERIVADELGKLGEGWSVLHDIAVGTRNANIDHVVVGPGGVFTVNAKFHAGKAVWVGGDTVLIDGHRQPYVRNARHEAARASRLLSAAYGRQVPVTGIVAVLAQSWTVKAQPADGAVLVLRPSMVRRLVQTLPVCSDSDEVDRLVMCARRSTTWQPDA